ncbi:MAG TPA: maleylacetoacetate isomerase, partial [Polyangiaceae bacterium]|nr:maleylacetoacetate isomerase [Polyangiaceae bacterium]
WRSSASHRVRIALGLKGLPFEYAAVHLIRDGGAQHQAAFGDLNPLRQVPVLEVEDSGQRVALVQSVAIIEYLDERFPEPPLLPRTALDRAHVRALTESINSGIQPLQNTDTFRELRRHGIDTEDWARTFIAKGLAALEKMAAPRAGAFLFGDGVSLADVYLVPQLYNARRWGVALAAFPTLLRADENARRLPAFLAAAPDQQPDAEQP